MKMIALVGCAALAACATTPAEAGGECRSDGLEAFNGRTMNDALGKEMLKASGAKTLRSVGPGMAVTQDFRADRLTVSYDEQNKVVRASCG